MDLLQLIQMMQNSNNPMGILEQVSSQNPLMSRAVQMSSGKSVGELQNIVRNLAQQIGMNEQQLNEFLSHYGLKL